MRGDFYLPKSGQRTANNGQIKMSAQIKGLGQAFFPKGLRESGGRHENKTPRIRIRYGVLLCLLNLWRFRSVLFKEPPAAEKICGDKEAVSQYPRCGRCKAGCVKSENANKICNGSSSNHFKHACKGGCGRKSHSLNGEADDIYQRKREIERCQYEQELLYQRDKMCALFIKEYHCQIVACEQQEQEACH